jgi:hypothetical protein
MTAEVAILNSMGVALAADSAVSIGGSGKVYNSANKLFALSKSQPVGIMVYGNARFMSVPWEVVIKHYRSNVLKEKAFNQLQDYAKSFIEFLEKTVLFPAENEVMYAEMYARGVFDDVARYIDSEMKKYLTSHKNIAKSIALKEMRKSVNEWLVNETAKSQHLLPLTPKEKTSFKSKNKANILRAISSFFGSVNGLNLPKTVIDKLVNCVFIRLFSIDDFLTPSGVVIAGFGSNEIYPTKYQLQIEGRVGTRLKMKPAQVQEISVSNNASIAPFAQREMVDMFMCGIDPNYRKAIQNNLQEEFKKIAIETIPNLGISLSISDGKKLEKVLQDQAKKVIDACAAVEKKNFVRPVLNSVAALPLDELAAMAEALVNLTSFKRRVTIEPESVGGPIDVAVISKGDGFIWIKRKHYFKSDLNHHFFER